MIRLGLILMLVSYVAGFGCVSRVEGPSREARFEPAPRASRPVRAAQPALDRQLPPRRPIALPRQAPPPPPPSAERVVTVGHSVQGRPLVVHEFGTHGPCLFVFGGIHGSEPTSVDIAEGVLGLLRQDPGLYANCRIAVMPRANPDGLERGRRANANRVDLNRNFPAANWRRRSGHGSRPGSEPETQAIVALMNRLQPSAVISVHSIQSQPPCNNYDGPGQGLAELMSGYNGYAAKASIGYPTPGSFGSWCGGDLGIPTITLELPRRQPGQQAWERNREAMHAVVRNFAQGATAW